MLVHSALCMLMGRVHTHEAQDVASVGVVVVVGSCVGHKGWWKGPNIVIVVP